MESIIIQLRRAKKNLCQRKLLYFDVLLLYLGLSSGTFRESSGMTLSALDALCRYIHRYFSFENYSRELYHYRKNCSVVVEKALERCCRLA